MELALLWRWYDDEPSLRCAVITGAGDMAFCSGGNDGENAEHANMRATTKGLPAGGFTGMLDRDEKKPIVVACNGHAHGKFRWDTDGWDQKWTCICLYANASRGWDGSSIQWGCCICVA